MITALILVAAFAWGATAPNLWAAVLGGIVLGLVNFIVNVCGT
jgi:uncharacterized membrane protein YvlD (DUF360 family)